MRDVTDGHRVIRMGDSQARDAHEFSRLYRESYPMVYGYVRRRMECDAAAEDIVSEAYLLAALFNAVSTIDNHYAMLVRHDFYGTA